MVSWKENKKVGIVAGIIIVITAIYIVLGIMRGPAGPPLIEGTLDTPANTPTAVHE